MFTPKIDADATAALLREVEVGEIVPWPRLSAAAGVDCKGGGRSSLYRIRERLLREERLLFEVVPDGLRRLNDREKILAGGARISKARMAARRSVYATMSVDDFDSLPPSMKARHTAQVAIATAVATVLTLRAVKQIEGLVTQTPVIDVGATLEAMRAAVAKPIKAA
jgi:hypothetical protein